MTTTTPAPAGLDELDALLAAALSVRNNYPSLPKLEALHDDGESQVILAWSDGATADFVETFDAETADLIAAAINRAPAMLAAIRAAYALHVPVEWFEEVEPGDEVFDPTKPLGSFCRECTDDEYVEAVEGGYAIDQGSPVIAWPCPTVTALDEALGAAK